MAAGAERSWAGIPHRGRSGPRAAFPRLSDYLTFRPERERRAVPAPAQPPVVAGDHHGAGRAAAATPRAPRRASARCGWSARRAAAGRAARATRSASASRRCWPTLSTPTGRRQLAWVQAGPGSRSGDRRARSAAGVHLVRGAVGPREHDVLRQVADPARAAPTTVPAVGGSSPASTLSSVDFPEPFGAGDQQPLAGGHVEPGYGDPAGDLEVAQRDHRPVRRAAGSEHAAEAAAARAASAPGPARAPRCAARCP